MTTLEKSLIEKFNKYKLIPPTQKDEDWLYYNLDNILNLNLSKKEIKETNLELNEHYLYFLNGELHDHSLPSTIEIKKEPITSKKTKNSFINLANKTSSHIKLIAKSSNCTINIIYENNIGINSTFISTTADNSNLTINRKIICKNENSITNNYNQFELKNNSTIVTNEENIKNTGYILDFTDATLANNCHLIGLNQTYLSKKSRFQNRIYIDGENATARLNGLAINNTNESSFYNTHIYHNVKNTESHQLFKSINKLNATFEYNGKVSVKKDAQQINSYQLNQNILLNDYANIYSRPQLFIDADDVKCSHGSTTGDLNQHELFYLMSRGLDKNSSRKIVLRAFIEECFNHKLLNNFKPDLNEILNHII